MRAAPIAGRIEGIKQSHQPYNSIQKDADFHVTHAIAALL